MWPENLAAVQLFCALQTQWRLAVGMGGAAHVGLDYTAVEAAMRMKRVKPTERERLFASLRVMESAALKLLNRKHDG